MPKVGKTALWAYRPSIFQEISDAKSEKNGLWAYRLRKKRWFEGFEALRHLTFSLITNIMKAYESEKFLLDKGKRGKRKC